MQDGRPLAFHSYRFNKHERNYAIGEQELLAVVLALKHWRCYLEGAEVMVVMIDHKPNTYLDTKSHEQLTSRQVRWQQFLSRFHFDWEYRKGCCNVADPLSRHPDFLHVLAQQAGVENPAMLHMLASAEGETEDAATESTVSSELLESIQQGYALDDFFAHAHNLRGLIFSQGYWKKGNMIVVPVGDLRQRCISLHHDAPYAGHLGCDQPVTL